MGFFNKVDKTRLEAAITKAATLEKENAGLLEEIKSNRQTIAGFVDVSNDFDNQVNELKKTHAKEVENFKQQLVAKETSVNAKANRFLAKMGVNSLAPEELTETKYETPVDVYHKWKSLDGYEKGKYFKENENLIKEAGKYLARKQ